MTTAESGAIAPANDNASTGAGLGRTAIAVCESAERSRQPVFSISLDGLIDWVRTGAPDPDLTRCAKASEWHRTRSLREWAEHGPRNIRTATADYRAKLLEQGDDKLKAKAVKSGKRALFPAAAPGWSGLTPGDFSQPYRKAADAVCLTAITHYDLDGVTDPAAAVESAAALPGVVASGLSAGGSGVWVFLAWDRPPADGHDDYERRFWAGAAHLFRAGLRVEFDADTKSVDRAPSSCVSLRFLSHDPAAYYDPAKPPLTADGIPGTAESKAAAGYGPQEPQNAPQEPRKAKAKAKARPAGSDGVQAQPAGEAPHSEGARRPRGYADDRLAEIRAASDGEYHAVQRDAIWALAKAGWLDPPDDLTDEILEASRRSGSETGPRTLQLIDGARRSHGRDRPQTGAEFDAGGEKTEAAGGPSEAGVDPELGPLFRLPAGVKPTNEDELAGAMAAAVAGRVRFVDRAGAWMVYTPKGWVRKLSAQTLTAVGRCARDNFWRVKDGELIRNRYTGGKHATARAVYAKLSGAPGVHSTPEQWDSDPDLLGLPNGRVWDVKTGCERQITPADLIMRTLRSGIGSAEELAASRFAKVVEHVMPHEVERRYVQTRLGAALLDRHAGDDLLWLHGPHGSGKGTFLYAMEQSFGTNAAGVPLEELRVGGNRGHLQWKACLAGARLIYADDFPVDWHLSEGTVNQLLGSEITANHMREKNIYFRLKAPLLVTSNAPPPVEGINVRRVRPVSCGSSIDESDADTTLRASMASQPELRAAVRWLMDGAERFLAEGLTPPKCMVLAAREAAQHSLIGEFSAAYAETVRADGGWSSNAALFAAWTEHCRIEGVKPATLRVLKKRLKTFGWSDQHGGPLKKDRGVEPPYAA